MFGNAGYEPTVVWQAKNEHHIHAGGTTIKGAQDPLDAEGNRRYYFTFKSNDELEHFLKLLGISPEEWNDLGGRFYREEYIAPANKVELADGEMDIDYKAMKKIQAEEEDRGP